MPVPVNITDLSETASVNSPAGSETVGPQANDYIQVLSAFIRQLYDGNQLPLVDSNFNSHKLLNVLAGAVNATSSDGVNGSQLYTFTRPVIGEVRMWGGFPSEASVQANWPGGWHLANGQNGTPDLRDRFVVGAGLSYNVGNNGGVNTQTLAVANLPVHTHAYGDPGHVHALGDPGHAHGTNDPGHAHEQHTATWYNTAGFTFSTSGGGAIGNGSLPTQLNGTGISITAATSNISMGAAATGIVIGNTGSNAPFENRPPYYALSYVYYTGA